MLDATLTQVVSLWVFFRLVMGVNGELIVSYLNCLNMNDYWTQMMLAIKQVTAKIQLSLLKMDAYLIDSGGNLKQTVIFAVQFLCFLPLNN